MCLLVESIKVSANKLWNIKYHNERMNRSRRLLFNCSDMIDLEKEIKLPENLTSGIYKSRVIYKERIISIEFIPYRKKEVRTLKVVHDDAIDYSFKFEDRSNIYKLIENIETDDILIVKNGLVTDTSFSNVVFGDGEVLVTPATPLLKGTKRAKLLEEGIIDEKEIHINDLKKYNRIYLINCMIDLNDNNGIPIESVFL